MSELQPGEGTTPEAKHVLPYATPGKTPYATPDGGGSLVVAGRYGSADEAEVLGSGEIRIEVGLLGNVASHRFIGVEVCQHVASIEAHLAAGRLQESREDLDRRALARSVRTEQAEHFTRPDVE